MFIKELDQFFAREDFIFTARIPAKQSDKVKNSFRQVAFLTVILDKLKGVCITFGQFLTRFRVDNQGHVTKLWRFPTKCFIYHELLRCISNVVISTDNVRNFHQVVIHHNRKIISWITVFFLDNPVTTDVTTFKFNLTFDKIVPLVNTRFIDCKTDCWNNACCFTLCDISRFFIFRHSQIFIDVTRCFSSSFLTFTLCCQLFLRHV